METSSAPCFLRRADVIKRGEHCRFLYRKSHATYYAPIFVVFTPHAIDFAPYFDATLGRCRNFKEARDRLRQFIRAIATPELLCYHDHLIEPRRRRDYMRDTDALYHADDAD